jgi:hypothetical protein
VPPRAPFPSPRARPPDDRLDTIASLLLYPESDLSRNLEAYRQATKYSDIPLVPVAREMAGMHCICQSPGMDATMAMCSVCGCWSHLACYSLPDEHAVPEIFLCLYCQAKIAQCIRRKVVLHLREIREEFTRVLGTFRPVADLADASFTDALAKLNGQTERLAAMAQFERFIAEAKDAWARIRELYGEIQKELASIEFERKADEFMDNEWDEGSRCPQTRPRRMTRRMAASIRQTEARTIQAAKRFSYSAVD